MVDAKVARDKWTLSPESASQHLISLPPEDRVRIMRTFESFSRGENGGQIEPWSFYTVRGALYPNWSDEDFKTALELTLKNL